MHTSRGRIKLRGTSFSLEVPNLSEEELLEFKTHLIVNVDDVLTVIKQDDGSCVRVYVYDSALGRIRDIQRIVLHEAVNFLNALPLPTR